MDINLETQQDISIQFKLLSNGSRNIEALQSDKQQHVPASFLKKAIQKAKESQKQIFGILEGNVVIKIEPTVWKDTLYLPVSRGKVWPKNSIVIYCGETVESWDDTSVKTGIGASELSVIFLSQLWTNKGYEVTVFCNCSDKASSQFKHFSEFDSSDSFDILIVWRLIELFYYTKLDTRLCLFDVHDIVDPRQINKQVKNTVNFFCMKSIYHSTMLTTDRLFICPNGGAMSNVQVQKDPNYIIYTSSYDRGLAFMLKWGWPLIKKLVPTAYLKLYYGWNSFDAIKPNTSDVKLYKKTIQDLIKQNGITDCGRVSHDELMLEKQKATIHWYTGDFQEIDCVSVRESASVGCIPVVSDFMQVFREKPYCVRVEGDPRTKNCQELAGKTVAEILLNKNKRLDLLKKLYIVNSETWENTAEKWEELFNRNK